MQVISFHITQDIENQVFEISKEYYFFLLRILRRLPVYNTCIVYVMLISSGQLPKSVATKHYEIENETVHYNGCARLPLR